MTPTPAPKGPKPFWRHLLGASGLAVIVFAAVGLSRLFTWWLGDVWGLVALVAATVLALAAFNWWTERNRRPRIPAEPPSGGEIR